MKGELVMKKLLILFSILFVFISCKNSVSEPRYYSDGFIGDPYFGELHMLDNPTTFISKEPLIEGTDIYLYVRIMDGNSYGDLEIIYGIGSLNSKPQNFDNYKPIKLLYDGEYYAADEAYFEGLNPASSSVIQKGNIVIYDYEFDNYYNRMNKAVITFTEGTSYDNKEIYLKQVRNSNLPTWTTDNIF